MIKKCFKFITRTYYNARLKMTIPIKSHHTTKLPSLCCHTPTNQGGLRSPLTLARFFGQLTPFVQNDIQPIEQYHNTPYMVSTIIIITSLNIQLDEIIQLYITQLHNNTSKLFRTLTATHNNNPKRKKRKKRKQMKKKNREKRSKIRKISTSRQRITQLHAHHASHPFGSLIYFI